MNEDTGSMDFIRMHLLIVKVQKEFNSSALLLEDKMKCLCHLKRLIIENEASKPL